MPAALAWSPQTTLWWVSGEEYLGRIDIRHQLTDRGPGPAHVR
jgi:predicted acetyltransferase